MRMFGRLTAVFLLCALLGSCATMMAYEQERQKKRSKPAVAATTGQEAVGSLFQPNLPKPKVDTQGLAASQSVANAEKQLAETDPTKTAGVAPGPSIPMLKTLLLTREDLDAVLRGLFTGGHQCPGFTGGLWPEIQSDWSATGQGSRGILGPLYAPHADPSDRTGHQG